MPKRLMAAVALSAALCAPVWAGEAADAVAHFERTTPELWFKCRTNPYADRRGAYCQLARESEEALAQWRQEARRQQAPAWQPPR